MRTCDVLDFIVACMNEAEADGYQQQDDGEALVPSLGVNWGFVTPTMLWVKVGEEYRVVVSKRRK